MANNKVQLADGSVLIDLTSDTVTAAALRSGYTAHDSAGNVVNGALEVDPVYSVTKNLTNVTTSNDDTKVIAGNSFHMDLHTTTGLYLDRVIVTMNGVDITDQAFSPIRDYYSVTSFLNGGVSSSNNDFEVIAGDSFHMDLTPDSGKIINSVTVIMGGVDITSQVFKPGVGDKIFTANGTYNASADYLSGYSSVTVNVPSSSGSNEKLLASGTYTVSSASSSITIDTGISNLDTTKPRKALVVGALSSASAGFMKWFSVVYITGPDTMTATSGTNYPKARYYNSAASAGGIVNYQNGSASNSICYIGTNGSTIVCRQWSNNYKIQPSTYSWYIWGEETI